MTLSHDRVIIQVAIITTKHTIINAIVEGESYRTPECYVTFRHSIFEPSDHAAD